MFKKGNSKINNNTLIFCLPTHVCYGEGKQCKGCYALKSEQRFPAVLASRKRNFEACLRSDFVGNAVKEIKKAALPYFRIHESGDFFAQTYVNSWTQIIAACPEVKFYTYTKKAEVLNLSPLTSQSNFNLVNGSNFINYGDEAFCNDLVENKGYVLCPCRKGDKEKICMASCFACTTEKRVCFIKH